jgi:hypothetical protein
MRQSELLCSCCKEYTETPGQEKKQKPLYKKAEGPTSLGQTDTGIFTAISSFTPEINCK